MPVAERRAAGVEARATRRTQDEPGTDERPVAGRYCDRSAVALLDALAGEDAQQAVREVAAWAATRDMDVAIAQLADAAHRRPSSPLVPSLLFALWVDCGQAALPSVIPLLDDDLLDALAGTWLVGIQDEDDDEDDDDDFWPAAVHPASIAVALAALGDAEEALAAWGDMGDVRVQQLLVRTVSSWRSLGVEQLLHALAELHPDAPVARAARRALFRRRLAALAPLQVSEQE